MASGFMVHGYRACGKTEDRPKNVGAGLTFWNESTGKLEVCTGVGEWADVGGPGVVAPAATKEEKPKKK